MYARKTGNMERNENRMRVWVGWRRVGVRFPYHLACAISFSQNWL